MRTLRSARRRQAASAACCDNGLRRQHDRVATLDIDVHHGNGTQAIFYDRDDVLTVSIHADPSSYYPFFVGYAHETGEGAGEVDEPQEEQGRRSAAGPTEQRGRQDAICRWHQRLCETLGECEGEQRGCLRHPIRLGQHAHTQRRGRLLEEGVS